MKKALMIIIMVVIVIIISLTPGCLIQESIAIDKTKEAITKFDEEYWKISEEWVQLEKEFRKNTEDVKSDPNAAQEVKTILEKQQKGYSEYILKFKSINIPEPLDEFYYKKIEQFNSIMMMYNDFLRWADLLSLGDSGSKELEELSKEANSYSLFSASKIYNFWLFLSTLKFFP